MTVYTPNVNKVYMQTEEEYGKIWVYWLRPVYSEKESLYTTRTRHRFYELQYVLSGELQIRLPEMDITMRAGEFLLIPPGVYHEITGYRENTVKLVFAFEAKLNNDVLADGLEKSQCVGRRESDNMRRMAEMLITVGMDLCGIGEIQAKALAEAFFFEIVRQVVPETAFGREIRAKKRKLSQKQRFGEELMAYIRSGAGKGFFTVEELAGAFHVNRRHLDRVCKELFNKTPRQLIDEERLRYIRDILSTTDYTLRDIAFLSGFSSEYSLARFFREKEGYSPGQHRKYSAV